MRREGKRGWGENGKESGKSNSLVTKLDLNSVCGYFNLLWVWSS